MAAEKQEPGKKQMGLESPMAMQKLHVSLSIWGKLFTDILIHVNTPAAFPLLDKRAKLKRNRSQLQKRMPLTVLSQAEVDHHRNPYENFH